MATVHAPGRVSTTREEFRNEPLVDFTRAENVRHMREALERVRAELGREYDLVIGGKRVRTEKKIRSINPARPAELVGLHQHAGQAEVEPAMDAAVKAFATWKRAPWEERAALIFRVA